MKKLNKFFAILVALAMMATLCVSMAFAKPDDPLDNPLADSNLVKYFQVAEGVTVPDATFTFTVTPEYTTANVDSVPAAKTPTFSLNTYTDEELTAKGSGVTDDGNSVYMTKPLNEIFDVNSYKDSGAGVYYYSVRETEKTNATIDAAEDKDINYDGTVYLVRVYVTVGEDGNLEISNVTVQEAVTDDDGDVVKDEETGEPQGTGGKVDATVEDPTIPDEDADDYDNKDNEDPDDDVGAAERNDNGTIATEGFTFTNIYTETQETDEPFNPEGDTPSYGAIAVNKTVDADDATAKAAAFPFTMTVTPATGHEADATYVSAKKYAKNAETGAWEEVTGAANAINFTKNSEGKWVANFSLTDGQYVVIDELPAGSKYVVKENLQSVEKANYYTAEYALTGSSTATKTDAIAGEELTTPTVLLAKTDAGDKVAYTNTFDDELNTPTGILINNLPYIALALVAIGGLCAYVIVRRKADDEA